MKMIVFQGDSITDMCRSREDAGNLGIGYPTLVAGSLGFKCPGEYKFINRGVNGSRIVDLYARIKSDIINLRPDVISILIGVNDVAHEFNGLCNGVDADKYYKIYCMLIDEIQQALPEVKIMILEPFALKGSLTESDWERFRIEVSGRAEKARQVAETYNLTFISLQEKFDAANELYSENVWLADGVHPTSAGHELIKTEWINAFQRMTRRNPSGNY